jgi:carbon monoxide dehydrogenase subunit G
MNVTGQYTFAHFPPAVLWPVLLDAQQWRNLLPDCTAVVPEVAPRQTVLFFRRRIGPYAVQTYQVNLSLTPTVPERQYQFEAQVQNEGGEVMWQGQGEVQLTPAEKGTVLAYKFSGELGGNWQQLGNPILETIGRATMRQFLTQLDVHLHHPQPPAELLWHKPIPLWWLVGGLVLLILWLIWWRKK